MNDYSKVKTGNEMELIFSAISENEGLARVAAAAFVTTKNPTLEEVADIKTAVSEAVTNAIIHGYEEEEGKVILRCRFEENVLWVEVEDKGVGIENIDRAMEPMYTTKPDMERSGMGFSFMEAFMDELEVTSVPGEGTLVRMKKEIGVTPWIYEE
ncbi:MAG: anti-sigma F factor [Lachnospiraceae bacterium]|nr:anti-sigma F factor [Lachnospiraceae bacterium]